MLKLKISTGKFYARHETPEGLEFWKQQPAANKARIPFKPQAQIMLSDVNGQELEFDANNPDEVRPGMKVTQGGNPANGEFKFPDGKVIVCKEGTITEIRQPANVQARINRTKFQQSLI